MTKLLLDINILKPRLQDIVIDGESLIDKQHSLTFSLAQEIIVISGYKAKFLLDYIKSEEIKQRGNHAPE